MNITDLKRNAWTWGLMGLGWLTLMTSAEALPFVGKDGDMVLGFRKPGGSSSYEVVVDLGPVTNYVNLASGASTNITQYTITQIVPDSWNNLTNLSWSVTAYTASANTFPGYAQATIWATVPRGEAVPQRNYKSAQTAARACISSILSGAVTISSSLASNQDNTTTFVQEQVASANGQNYSVYMQDTTTPSVGDLQANGPQDAGGNLINLENNTGVAFTSPLLSDLYQMVPVGSTDPQSGTTSGAGYLVGTFQLNINGSLTFTRASSSVSAPTAGSITASVTNGFAPLTVVFANTSSGSITNWVWSFGNGTSLTNTSSGSVTNVYTTNGTYSVTLTVRGSGGSSSVSSNNYIAVYSTPKFSSSALASGKALFSGTNCPAGVQYRILASTNLTTWVPVLTNTFLGNGTFTYTNAMTNAAGYFRLVSP